jgi:hypothetical protein
MGGEGEENSLLHRLVFLVTASRQSSFSRSRCNIAYRESPVY